MTGPDGTLPADMVEAGARALHEHDRLEFVGDPPWDGLTEDDRDSYRHTAVAVLTAALAVHVPEHCQYGRVRADGLVLPTATEGTHYRYVGPWCTAARVREIDQRGICGDRAPLGRLTGRVCELLAGHAGWHQCAADGGDRPMSWTARP